MGARLVRSLALLSLLAGLGSAQGAVHVVDIDGGGEFLQIQDAVNAAQAGDTVLVVVRSREYDAVDVSKALSIVGRSPADHALVREVTVHNLASDETVVLSGLAVNTPSHSGTGISPTIWLHTIDGSVRLARCVSNGKLARPNAAALTVTECFGSAAWTRCTLVGPGGLPGDEANGGPGGVALVVRHSIAAGYDGTITGGHGGDLHTGFVAGRGGPGIMLESFWPIETQLLLSNTVVAGGRGGDLSSCQWASVSGHGGAGYVSDPDTTTTLFASTIAGGSGGAAPPCGVSGNPGVAREGAGLVIASRLPPLSLSAPTVAHEGETIALAVEGVPGDRVSLLVGLETAYLARAGGVQLVAPMTQKWPGSRARGTLGADGALSLRYSLPQLPAGVEASNLWLQVVARHADGARTYGSFAVVTVLDSSIP